MVRILLQKVVIKRGHWGQRSKILHGTLHGQYTCCVKIKVQSENKNLFLFISILISRLPLDLHLWLKKIFSFFEWFYITLGQSKVATFWIEYWGLRRPRWSGPLGEPSPMFNQITDFRLFEKINFQLQSDSRVSNVSLSVRLKC